MERKREKVKKVITAREIIQRPNLVNGEGCREKVIMAAKGKKVNQNMNTSHRLIHWCRRKEEWCLSDNSSTSLFYVSIPPSLLHLALTCPDILKSCPLCTSLGPYTPQQTLVLPTSTYDDPLACVIMPTLMTVGLERRGGSKKCIYAVV